MKRLKGFFKLLSEKMQDQWFKVDDAVHLWYPSTYYQYHHFEFITEGTVRNNINILNVMYPHLFIIDNTRTPFYYKINPDVHPTFDLEELRRKKWKNKMKNWIIFISLLKTQLNNVIINKKTSEDGWIYLIIYVQ